MSTFNEATTKPATWTTEEIENICLPIIEMVKANNQRDALATLGFLSSQNDGISKASSDEHLAALLEVEAANREALFDKLASYDDIPEEFLEKVAARFGIEYGLEDEPAPELGQDLNLEPAPQPA